MSDYSLLIRAHEALLAEHEKLKAEVTRLKAALDKVLPRPHRNDHDA